jgi:hypothetical protein
MDATARREIALVALTTAICAVPLTFAFAHREAARVWEAQPYSLVILGIVGVLTSFLGSMFVYRLPLPRWRAFSKPMQVVHGAAVGILFGLVAGAAGWLAADASLWALLVWFFFGAALLGVARSVLPRKVKRDG